ncbi:MAG: diguanylate cyclase [Lachnospiraceae bacterium]|nr:diguanylate cyclase [Lachnospiraceae bacterium]
MQSDEELKKIPVIVLTSDSSAEVKSLRMGAADFIPKPYDIPDVILTRIEKTIRLFETISIVNATELDPLTGLYNKEYFMEYSNVLDQHNPDRKMDAAALNINRFHILNEIYGRSFGDELLLMLGRAINDYVGRCEGIACRYDADGYYLYIPHGHNIPEELSEVIAEYETDDMRDIHIRVRFGIYPDVDREYDVLRRFDCALLACNSIKGDYGNRVAYYDSSMHEKEAY